MQCIDCLERNICKLVLTSAFQVGKSGSLTLSTTPIEDWIILCCGGCPGYCGIFTSIPGISPLDDSSSTYLPQVVTTQTVSQHCPLPPEPLRQGIEFHCIGGRTSASSNCPLAHGNLHASVQGSTKFGLESPWSKLAGVNRLLWALFYSHQFRILPENSHTRPSRSLF